jgi:hypothetical protein
MEKYCPYPPRIVSNCALPVAILKTLFLWWPSSIAVMNPEADG